MKKVILCYKTGQNDSAKKCPPETHDLGAAAGIIARFTPKCSVRGGLHFRCPAIQTARSRIWLCFALFSFWAFQPMPRAEKMRNEGRKMRNHAKIPVFCDNRARFGQINPCRAHLGMKRQPTPLISQFSPFFCDFCAKNAAFWADKPTPGAFGHEKAARDPYIAIQPDFLRYLCKKRGLLGRSTHAGRIWA